MKSNGGKKAKKIRYSRWAVRIMETEAHQSRGRVAKSIQQKLRGILTTPLRMSYGIKNSARVAFTDEEKGFLKESLKKALNEGLLSRVEYNEAIKQISGEERVVLLPQHFAEELGAGAKRIFKGGKRLLNRPKPIRITPKTPRLKR